MTKIQKRFSEPLFDANEFFSLKSSTPQPTFETKLNESETKSSYSVPTDNLSESSFCNEVPLFFNFKDREHSTSFDFEPFESQKYEYSLPHEDLAGENWIKVISPETVKDLQEGKFNRPYLVIDCRYGYEYQGKLRPYL